MSPDAWAEANNRYLAASLAWLQLRLRRLVANEPAVPRRVVAANDRVATKGTRSGVLGRLFGWVPSGLDAAPPSNVFVSSTPQNSLPGDIRSALAAREEAAQIDPPPALVLLEQRFGLST